MSLTQLLVVCALVVGGNPHTVRVANVSVQPEPFLLDYFAVTCQFEGTPAPGAQPRCSVRIEDDVTGKPWISEWQVLPPRNPREAWRMDVPVGQPSDSLTALRIDEISVTVTVDDGTGRLRVCKRDYYKWKDGLFRSSIEYPSLTDGSWNSLPPEPTSQIIEFVTDQVALETLAEQVPTEAILEASKPLSFTTLGAMKSRYAKSASVIGR